MDSNIKWGDLGEVKMNKFINRYKLLFAVMAVMSFLPTNNLFADWDWYFDPYIGPDEYDPYNDQYMSLLTDLTFSYYSPPYNDEDGGFVIWPGTTVYAYTDAWIWSKEDEYSNDVEIYGDVEVDVQKDWEWDGPPGEAP